MSWGIIPAAGAGTRIQPLAFSKELLPVGSRLVGSTERPCAVSEYLVERMLRAGADKLCFVISPTKSDILAYYGGAIGGAAVSYVVQLRPDGLCDALFQARHLIRDDEDVLVGLPDTIWLPENDFELLERNVLSFLLFPVDHPELFDAVITGPDGSVIEVQVKSGAPACSWVWGALRMPGHVLHELQDLWLRRERSDVYLGTLVNAYVAEGGRATGVRAGTAYVDVGTVDGYRQAMQLLVARPSASFLGLPSAGGRLGALNVDSSHLERASDG